MKLAVTVLFEFMVTVHVPVPEQSPDQLLKVQPELVVKVTGTRVPS